MKTIKIFYLLLLALILSGQCLTTAQPMLAPDAYNFFIVSDLDRGGKASQPVVAGQLRSMARKLDPHFIVLAGDCFHGKGVASVDDPRWDRLFEGMYPEKDLPMPWFPIIGNHEYRGNAQALVDYSTRSPRWQMEGRYYTRQFDTGSGTTFRIVLLDTSPFVERYKDHADYPSQIREEDTDAQLKWLEEVLSENEADWTIVVGHHPVYSVDGKHGKTRELIKRVDPLLREYGVDMYISGHIHNFQHLNVNGFDYLINSSGGEGRPSESDETTRFHSPSAGFSVCTVISPKDMAVQFVGENGKVIYTFQKNK